MKLQSALKIFIIKNTSKKELVLLVKLAMQSTYVKGNVTSVLVVKAEGEFLPSCAWLRKNTLCRAIILPGCCA